MTLNSEGVYPAAICEHLHEVEDQIVGDGIAFAVTRYGRLLVLVGPAAPPNRDAGVRHVIDLVVGNHASGRVSYDHGVGARELDSNSEDVVVDDAVIQCLAGGCSRWRVNASHRDAISGYVGKYRAGDRRPLGPITQAQSRRSQMKELVIFELDVPIAGEGDRCGFGCPRCIGTETVRGEAAETLPVPGAGAGERVPGLNFGKAFARLGLEPGGVGEPDALEGD